MTVLWRVAFVSMLMVGGAFGNFFRAENRGLPVETARTIVVNAIVVMEVFYLFTVRYIHGTALTWRGLLGTRAVLLRIVTVVVGQFAFTYLPFMQAAFDTRAIGLVEGAAVIATGVALLFLVEAEKRLRLARSRSMAAHGHRRTP